VKPKSFQLSAEPLHNGAGVYLPNSSTSAAATLAIVSLISILGKTTYFSISYSFAYLFLTEELDSEFKLHSSYKGEWNKYLRTRT
jgi:hypothetical protein